LSFLSLISRGVYGNQKGNTSIAWHGADGARLDITGYIDG
jgi:hypothetical protein